MIFRSYEQRSAAGGQRGCNVEPCNERINDARLSLTEVVAPVDRVMHFGRLKFDTSTYIRKLSTIKAVLQQLPE